MCEERIRADIRISEIRKRTAQKKRAHEMRICSFLSTVSLFLIAGIGILLHEVQTAGDVSVDMGYGSVLLRQGAGAYVVAATAAFAAGVAVTVLCFRIGRKRRNETLMSEEGSGD